MRDKGGVGIGSTTVTMECQLWLETNQCVFSCNKPKLLHLPCSHGYTARGKEVIEGDIRVTVLSQGGSVGHLEWRNSWLESAS